MNPLWRRGWLVEPECVWVIRLVGGGRGRSNLLHFTFCKNWQLGTQGNTVVRVDCIGWQVGTACSFFSKHWFPIYCLAQLHNAAETRIVALATGKPCLSWLSHSASILTHLNESVSRSSVGGYLTPPSFSTHINNFCSTSTCILLKPRSKYTKPLYSFCRAPKYRPSTYPQNVFVRFCSSRIWNIYHRLWFSHMALS